MVIIETPIFTRQITELLSDDEYGVLQAFLIEHPDAGAVIPGGGGLRKVAGLCRSAANAAGCG